MNPSDKASDDEVNGSKPPEAADSDDVEGHMIPDRPAAGGSRLGPLDPK